MNWAFTKAQNRSEDLKTQVRGRKDLEQLIKDYMMDFTISEKGIKRGQIGALVTFIVLILFNMTVRYLYQSQEVCNFSE